MRPKESYEVDVPEGYEMRRTGKNKYDIERTAKPDGRPIDSEGRPVDAA